MPFPGDTPNDHRVLILAPAGRDSAAARSILSRAGIETMICANVTALCRELEAGAGSLLLGEEAMGAAATSALTEVLGRQPSWSDVPILLLTGPGPDSATAAAAVPRLGNVTMFERPVRVASLVTAVRTALRVRDRQYDLRDRLALQTLLAAIVESSDDAIVGKTTDGIILTWNKAAERLFGYSAEEAVGRSITMLIPPDRQDEEREILDRISRGERVIHFETVRLTKDGRRFDASLTISPIRDASGHIIGASKVARDISAQKRTEFELRDADRRKDEFLAMLAHELRNPLAPIRNSLTLLEQPGQSDGMVQHVRGILQRQVDHMVRLVDDLMEVSRMTQGKIELRRERLDLAAAIRGVLETSEPQAREGELALTLDLPSEPLFVDADPVRLTQIVANLLNNAVQYSDPGGKVRLSARGESGEAVVSVRDSGAGIPGDMLERIFEMFMQVPGVERRGRAGLGIGLTLVRSLVQMHGGSIRVESPGLGQGSTFTFRLPLAVAPAPATPKPQETNGRRLALRILVVDDNEDAADSMGLVLQRAGADVEVVHDGPTALERIERFRPAMVLLDIGMPGMDGYEVARRIRARSTLRDIKIVALTGWGQPEDKRRSREAGFDHHLIKPAGIEQLRALVPATVRRGRRDGT
jgi:PAS domain S-box-containing protein